MAKRAGTKAARPGKTAAKAVSRRASASAPMAQKPAPVAATQDALKDAAASILRALATQDLEALPQESLRELMAAVVRAYSAKIQAGEQFLPFQFNSNRVSPTDVMLTCSGLLKAADLQVFELGMWQSFTGR